MTRSIGFQPRRTGLAQNFLGRPLLLVWAGMVVTFACFFAGIEKSGGATRLAGVLSGAIAFSNSENNHQTRGSAVATKLFHRRLVDVTLGLSKRPARRSRFWPQGGWKR